MQKKTSSGWYTFHRRNWYTFIPALAGPPTFSLKVYVTLIPATFAPVASTRFGTVAAAASALFQVPCATTPRRVGRQEGIAAAAGCG